MSETGQGRDRTVHARWEQMDVVRYDRAGKWYLEPRNPTLPRQRVSVADAARYARWAAEEQNGEIFYKRLGGAAFDRYVGKLAIEARRKQVA